MSTSPADFNTKIIEEFHSNEGRVGGMFEGMPLLLLHHTGAKSGKSRINPLAYQSDGGRYVIFASKAGAPTNPDWYHNLKAQPDPLGEDDERDPPQNGARVVTARRAGALGGDQAAFLVEAQRRGGDAAAPGDLSDAQQDRHTTRKSHRALDFKCT